MGPSEKPGRGSIHHLAIRVKNEEELSYWDKVVKDCGFQSTGVVDRFYFQSLYFRDSNGILFEIATDGPGFTADSTVEELGGKEICIPELFDDIFDVIDANDLTFREALTSQLFTLSNKSRIFAWIEESESQLHQAAFQLGLD